MTQEDTAQKHIASLLIIIQQLGGDGEKDALCERVQDFSACVSPVRIDCCDCPLYTGE